MLHDISVAMGLEEESGYKQQLNDVKGELKKWESNWAGDHNGSKPGRDDIKNNPEIGKYNLWHCFARSCCNI